MADFLTDPMMIMFYTNLFASTNCPVCKHSFSLEPVKGKADVAKSKDVLDRAYTQFKERKPDAKLTTVVDYAPDQWQEFFAAQLEQAGDELIVPNGCCTKDDCPLKIFYTCLYEALQQHQSQ